MAISEEILVILPHLLQLAYVCFFGGGGSGVFFGWNLALTKLKKAYVGVWYSVWINGIETGAHQSHRWIWKKNPDTRSLSCLKKATIP